MVVVVDVVVVVVVAELSMKGYYFYSRTIKCFGRAPACFYNDTKVVHVGNNFIKTLYSVFYLSVTIILNFDTFNITNICFDKVVLHV